MTAFLDRPLDVSFYESVRRAPVPPADRRMLSGFGGLALDVDAGSVLSIELLAGAQIVNLFAFNRDDPHERIWHQSLISEGIFLTPFARLWGTLPRYRPLLTMIADSLSERVGSHHAHHVGLGGSGTPADWRHARGRPTTTTTWEQLATLLADRGLSRHLLTQNLSLFQRSRVDLDGQRIEILPSHAVAGDRVAFFAEIDLCVLLALSPYLDGGTDPDDPLVREPAPVSIELTPPVAAPLAWPYLSTTINATPRGSQSREGSTLPPARAVRRAAYPFDRQFYDDLGARRDGFERISRHVVPPNSGYGFRVEAGNTFTFELIEGPQILDVCVLNADDPSEYYATGPQLAIEGGAIGRSTRLWSNPPRSRPLATCITDSVGGRVRPGPLSPHICHSDCCSRWFWLAVSGEPRRSCYDNLCDGLELLGLDPGAFQGNINLFMSAGFDSGGDLVEGRSAAVRGDRIEFFAEVPLHVALSVCPSGAGGLPDDEARSSQRPVAVEVTETHVTPRPWPP